MEEGLCLGGSAGVNIAGAVRMARKLGPGHTIVTILCDHGSRYQSKLYNPDFLREKGLPTPPWLARRALAEGRRIHQPALVPLGVQSPLS
jgi:cysteine synthase A